MAMLLVYRPWNIWNFTREIDFRVDDKSQKSVRNNSEVEIDLTPGSYEVSAHMDWLRSECLIIRIEEGETKRLEILPHEGSKIQLWITIITLPLFLYFYFFQKGDDAFMFLILAPLFLFQLYYLTLGRNKYFRIKEV